MQSLEDLRSTLWGEEHGRGGRGGCAISKILTIGHSTRYLVCAGKRAGYTMYSLDHFGDSDLLACADRYARFDGITNGDELMSHLDRLDWDFDAIILGAGFEYADLKGHRVLNNPPAVMRSAGNKRSFAAAMQNLGIPHPRVYDSYKICELDCDHAIRYPVMVKPVYGDGGVENWLAHSRAEIEEIERIHDRAADVLIQEYLEGVSASVSLIATKSDAVVLAVNEQLIGTPWLTAHRFAYCGNVTPYKSEYEEEMREIALKLVLKLGLVGSNGVDFLITDDGPVVIEVNPRFQGTLDTVEYVSGVSVFDAHVKAFLGELPDIGREKSPESCFAGRGIVFADRNCVIDGVVSQKLTAEAITDIPVVGCTIPAGEPITTVFCTGHSRSQVLQKLAAAAWRIRRMMP